MSENKLNKYEGKVLIADPFLQDPYFSRSVILLTEVNEQGSIGFILNKPLSLSIEDAIEDFPDFDKFLALGGPVEQEVMFFLHTKGDIIDGSVEVAKGLYWGGNFDQLKVLISQELVKESDIHFYLGYAGWSPSQLEYELKQGNWSVGDYSPLYIDENTSENIWKKAILRSDNKFSFLANFPENPSLN